MGHNEYSSELSSSTSQPLIKKMIPQLLLSVSLFSFVFSYSSLIYSPSSPSSLVYSPKFNLFSAKYFHLLSRIMNKNCLFLICNGLLVFLAKTSGLVRAPSESDDMLHKKIGLELLKETLLDKYVSDEIINDDDGQKEDEEEKEKEKDAEEEEKSGLSPKEVSIFVAESEEEEGACHLEDHVEKDENGAYDSRICWLFDDDDDDEEEEDGDEKVELSTEELNKKFEDFIRRMKDEIRVTTEPSKQKALVLSSSSS